MAEQPLLQGIAHLTALAAQGINTCLVLCQRAAQLVERGGALLLQAALLCLELLTLVHHCRLFLGSKRLASLLCLVPAGISLPFSLSHTAAHLLKRLFDM